MIEGCLGKPALTHALPESDEIQDNKGVALFNCMDCFGNPYRGARPLQWSDTLGLHMRTRSPREPLRDAPQGLLVRAEFRLRVVQRHSLPRPRRLKARGRAREVAYGQPQRIRT